MEVRKQKRLLDPWWYMIMLAALCMLDRQLRVAMWYCVNHNNCLVYKQSVLSLHTLSLLATGLIKGCVEIIMFDCLHLPSGKNK